MKLEKKLEKKLNEERRTKKWFVDTFCGGMTYSAVNLQLLGYNGLTEQVEKAIKSYLEE